MATRCDSNKRILHCESLESRRMLSGVTLITHGHTDSTAPQTVVYADPIGDVLVAGSPFQGQELAASNNLVDADGLGTIAATASSSPDYSPDYTTINGRNFGYYVPESYDPSTPTPLLFMFHGMGGNSSEQSGGSAENGYYGWQTTAHENEFIVLFPESLGYFKTWDLGAGGTSSDLSFVDDMIDWADTNYNISTSQIFTTGHSWGAYFSYYVARYRSDDIAAFATHSGGLGGSFFLGSTPPVPTGPSPTPTLNGIVLHAVDDGLVPYSNSQDLYDDLLANGHNVYNDGIGDDGIIEVDGWGPDNHRYRLQHNQTQWDFFLEVTDNDVPLVLNLAVADASIAEGAGAAATTATVTRSDPRGNLTVALTSNDVSEATLPATVTFLDGESIATVDIAAVDDPEVDGTQTVTVSAAATGYTEATDTLEVTDDDVPLVLNLAVADASVSEGAGAAATTATVTRTDPRGNLTVALTSDDTSEATVPATVTILDGQSSATFDVAAVDDSNVDGTQTVTLSAAAAGYPGATDTLSVTDDDVPFVAIIDNGDSGFTQTGFAYLKSQQVSDAMGGDVHHLRQGSGVATWTFTDLESGEYRVATTWDGKYDNKYNSLDAPFSIEDGSGAVLASTTVNQKNAPSDFAYGGYNWDTLGTVNIADGALVVNLGVGSNSSRYSVADAIRIERIGEAIPTLSLSIADASVSEAAGAAATTATVTRTDTRGDLVVTLTSDDTSEATVPATVTILDGQSSATIEIAVVDDTAADGTQTVTFSAAAAGYSGASGTLEVSDDEASLVAIIDNGDSGFTQTGFAYLKSQQVSDAMGGDVHHLRQGSGVATWTFTDLESGEYRVATTWDGKYDNKYNSLDAPFSIEDGSGAVLASTTVNQKNAPSDFAYGGYNWDTLGTVNIADGALVVNLGVGSNSSRYSVADAIRIERIGDVSADRANTVVDANVADDDRFDGPLTAAKLADAAFSDL